MRKLKVAKLTGVGIYAKIFLTASKNIESMSEYHHGAPVSYIILH